MSWKLRYCILIIPSLLIFWYTFLYVLVLRSNLHFTCIGIERSLKDSVELIWKLFWTPSLISLLKCFLLKPRQYSIPSPARSGWHWGEVLVISKWPQLSKISCQAHFSFLKSGRLPKTSCSFTGKFLSNLSLSSASVYH